MKVALFTIAKNEDHYIDEWLDYYVSMGFDDIFVCQNNWRANLKTDFGGKVHLLEADYEYAMMPSMNGFINEHYMDYDFAAFFELDEFLLLKKHDDIKQFLANYANYPAIGISWRMFGDAGLKKVENGYYSVLNRFKRSDSKLRSLIKVIVNFKLAGNRVQFYNPHIVNCPAVDADLTTVTINGNFENKTEDSTAELAHFRNKTYEERYERSFMKDDPLFGYISTRLKMHQINDRTDINEFNRIFEKDNCNDIENTSVIDFYNKLKAKQREISKT